MTKPNAEVNILPQVEKACGLDMHKDKIVCFIPTKTALCNTWKSSEHFPSIYLKFGI